jgi:hypothetical protein
VRTGITFVRLLNCQKICSVTAAFRPVYVYTAFCQRPESPLATYFDVKRARSTLAGSPITTNWMSWMYFCAAARTCSGVTLFIR